MTSFATKTDSLGFGSFLATLFLGAFNDNLSKMLVICYGTDRLGDETFQGTTFLSLPAGAGVLSKRKNRFQ